jgi:hypothetical protein
MVNLHNPSCQFLAVFLVRGDYPIAEGDHPLRALCHLRIVGNRNHDQPLGVQFIESVILFSWFYFKVTSRLFGPARTCLSGYSPLNIAMWPFSAAG